MPSRPPAPIPHHHLVTGAASGIGFALARRLLERGDAVMACDLRPEPLQALAAFAAAPERLLLQPLDVREPAQWTAALQRLRAHWPRLDLLCNCAGVLAPDFAPDIRPEQVDLHLDVNAKGSIHGCQAALALMREQPPRAEDGRRGQLVNLCSLAGLAPVPGAALYAASKFALRGYTLSIARELAPLGIAVTLVCPDAVATPMLEPHARRAPAALVFSGWRTLAVDEVVDLIVGRVLARAPLEALLPWHRAALCKLAGLAPALAAPLFAPLTRWGQRRQRRSASSPLQEEP